MLFSAVACRPEFNAQMTPPSSPVRPATAADETLHNRAALRAQLFLEFNLFCVKHGSWGVRPLLSLKRSSEDSQREKFLLQCYDKSPSLLFGSSVKSSADLVMRLQVCCVRFSLLPLTVLPKKRAAVRKAQWFRFCTSRACSGHTIFSYI